MTINNEKTKTNLKFLAISGIAAMMVFALSASSMSQNTYASGPDICDRLGSDNWNVVDAQSVTDTEAPFDTITVWKCKNTTDLNCWADTDDDGVFEPDTDDASVGKIVPKKAEVRTFCKNTTGVIMTSSTDANAVVTDTIPAEWFLGQDDITTVAGMCAVSDPHGNKNKGAIDILCTTQVFDGGFVAAFTIDIMETRESPSAGKGNPNKLDKWKPTGCGLDLNSGAEGFVPERTYDHDSNGGTDEVPFATPQTASVPIQVAGCDPI